MTRAFYSWLAASLAVALAAGGSSGESLCPSRSKLTGANSSHAAHLVQTALQAELAGNNAERGARLAEALASSPDDSAARWQSGQVRFDGQWRTPAGVANLVVNHPRWQEYRRLRRQARRTIADHVRLAQWCQRNGLANEERFHWVHVLLADPRHALARQRLGLREFRGGLFTQRQVQEYQQREKQAVADMKKYKPAYLELCRQARSPDAALRDAALRKIRGTDDPGAQAALDLAVERYCRGDRPEPTVVPLRLAQVAALTNIREHEATLRLLNLAVYAPLAEVREAAAKSLSQRPATDYMPLLMAAMAAPVEAQFDVVAAPDGMVRMIETIVQAGPEVNREHVRATNLEVEGVFGRDQAKTDPSVVVRGHLTAVASRAANTQAQVDAHNQELRQRNVRIQEAVKAATGMDLGDDPEAYWRAWGAENELYYDKQPTYSTYVEETSTYYYEQAPVYPAYGDPRQPLSLDSVVAAAPGGRTVLPGGPMECFAPGTPVWAQAGPTPIEQTAVGDLVLAQDPNTGELAYRPVRQTTVGEPIRMVRVEVGGEAIISTGGHRYWVNGSGWVMGKRLKAGMRLHSVDGAVDVSNVEDAELVVCHNLVVDEFHTFFVGRSRILVHDRNCPRPTTATVPGLVKPLTSPGEPFSSD